MTEAEWLESNRPLAMLRYLLDVAGPRGYPDRKFRLFACASVRRMESLLSDRRSWQAVATAERFAEGLVDRRALQLAHRAAQQVAIRYWQDWQSGDRSEDDSMAAQAAADAADDVGRYAAWEACSSSRATREADGRARCEVLRELFGNPFHPPVLPEGWRRWNDGVLVRLAQDIYQEQHWADLPVLADALEEVGCTDEAILQHCRSARGHMRGCWVLDLLRGEE